MSDNELGLLADQVIEVIERCFPPARRFRSARAVIGWPLILFGGAVFWIGYRIKGGSGTTKQTDLMCPSKSLEL